MIVPLQNNFRPTGKVRINWATNRSSCRNAPPITIQSETIFKVKKKNLIPHLATLKSGRNSPSNNHHHFPQSWMLLIISSWMCSINRTPTKRVSKTSFPRAWCRLGLPVEPVYRTWITDFLMSNTNSSFSNQCKPRTKKTEAYSRNKLSSLHRLL